MATKSTPFKNSHYFQLHYGVDEYFVTHHLIPGLKKQGVLGLGTPGIELPMGTNQDKEYLALSEAKELVLEFLINQINLPEKDQKILRNLHTYTSFADLSSNLINRDITQPKTLGATITPDRVEALQNSKTNSPINDPSGFSANDKIKSYNNLWLKLNTISTSGSSAQILSRLFPGGVSSVTDISQLQLAQVIVSNLVRLREASELSNQPDFQNYAVAQELSRILQNYPKLASYRNFLGDDSIQATLRQYVDSIIEIAQNEDPNVLENMDQLQLAYGKELNHHLFNESELRNQIYAALPLDREDERLALTDQILRAVVKSSLSATSLDETIKQLKLNKTLTEQVISSLHNSGLELSLEYTQGQIRFLVNSHRITPGELRLLKRGINPFLPSQNPDKKELVDKEKTLLSTYNSQSINAGKTFIALQEAYTNEIKKDHPDTIFVSKARSLLNRQRYYASLSTKERTLVESTRLGRWFTNTTSRISDIQDKFYDTVFDLTDTITGKKWIYKQWEKLDVILAKVEIPGTQIPLFRISTWLSKQIASWKKIKIEGLIAKSSTWPSPFGRWSHRRFKDYKLGNLTIKGMTYVGLHRAWSKLAYKMSGKVIKGGIIFSKKTFTRLLIKVGGKALAKIGLDTIASLSSVFTAVGIILIVKDVLELVVGILKWGWGQLKKLFGSAEGAAATIITGGIAGTGAILTAGATLVLGLFSPLIAPVATTIILVFSLAFGGIFLFSYLESGFNTSIHLDSEYVGPASAADLGPSVSCMSEGSVPDAAAPGVATRAREIIADLHTGFWKYCNRPTNPEQSELYFGVADIIAVPSVYNLLPANRPSIFDYELFKSNPDPTREEIQVSGNALYWCTYLVQHSYRESGKTGLSYSLWSPTLEDEFRQKFTFIEGSVANSGNVKPGDVIFFKVLGGPDRTNHVGIINNVDPPGFTYYQSNAPTINSFGSFNGGAKDSSLGVEVVGFGRI